MDLKMKSLIVKEKKTEKSTKPKWFTGLFWTKKGKKCKPDPKNEIKEVETVHFPSSENSELQAKNSNSEENTSKILKTKMKTEKKNKQTLKKGKREDKKNPVLDSDYQPAQIEKEQTLSVQKPEIKNNGVVKSPGCFDWMRSKKKKKDISSIENSAILPDSSYQEKETAPKYLPLVPSNYEKTSLPIDEESENREVSEIVTEANSSEEKVKRFPRKRRQVVIFPKKKNLECGSQISEKGINSSSGFSQEKSKPVPHYFEHHGDLLEEKGHSQENDLKLVTPANQEHLVRRKHVPKELSTFPSTYIQWVNEITNEHSLRDINLFPTSSEGQQQNQEIKRSYSDSAEIPENQSDTNPSPSPIPSQYEEKWIKYAELQRMSLSRKRNASHSQDLGSISPWDANIPNEFPNYINTCLQFYY